MAKKTKSKKESTSVEEVKTDDSSAVETDASSSESSVKENSETPKEEALDTESKADAAPIKEESPQTEEASEAKEPADQKSADTNKDGKISSREMVNTIDPTHAVSDDKLSNDEILTRQISKQLEEKDTYFILRIKKSVFLLLAGLLVLSLWFIPLARFLSSRYGISFDSLKQKYSQTKQEPTIDEDAQAEAASPSPSTVIHRIRIKASVKTDEVTSMVSLLKESGYEDTEIFITDDIESKGITVAAKKDNIMLLSSLLELLSGDYFVASSSSQVTADSDFSAVILIGK